VTRHASADLSPQLVERFSQGDLKNRLGVVLPFVTVDGEGLPHPMLLSYLEVRAYDAGTFGLVIQRRSGSARNLAQRGVGTLLVIEPDMAVYVKTRLVDGPQDVPGGEQFGLGYFLLGVESVLEDAPTDWEAGMGITAASQYRPLPTLGEPWALATLAVLANPRARA
jgi:hypothetical protein